MKTTLLAVLAIVILILAFLTPVAVIFAMNTLFALGIPYNIWTYLSVCILNLTWMRKTNLTFNKK